MPLTLPESCRSSLVVCGLSGKRYSGVAEFHELLKPLLPAGVVLIPRDGLCSLEALHRYVRWASACFFIRIEAPSSVREANGWKSKFAPEDLVRDEHWTEVGLDDWEGWDAVVQNDGDQEALLQTAKNLVPRIVTLCQTPALTKHHPIPEASVKRTEFTTPMPDCMNFGGAEAYVPSVPAPAARAEALKKHYPIPETSTKRTEFTTPMTDCMIFGGAEAYVPSAPAPAARAEVEHPLAGVEERIQTEQVGTAGSPTEPLQRDDDEKLAEPWKSEFTTLEPNPTASTSVEACQPTQPDDPAAQGSGDSSWWKGYQAWDKWQGYSSSWHADWNWPWRSDSQAGSSWSWRWEEDERRWPGQWPHANRYQRTD